MTATGWRFRCPEGHTPTFHRESGHYCDTCDEVYDELVDTAEKEVSFR